MAPNVACLSIPRTARLALCVSAWLFAQDVGAQADVRRVLVYGPGGTAAIDYLRTAPTVADGPARAVFTIATEAMWRSMTTADFATYNALWIDGGNCATPPDRGNVMFQAVTDTRLTWTPAITGHFEIIGSDSDLHISNPGARKFNVNSYHYVTSGRGTGLFVSTSCLFYQAPGDTPVPWLQGIGDFRVTGDGCTDGQRLAPGALSHPVHTGIAPPGTTLTLPGDLSWSCFTHSHFNRHPPSFQRVYEIGAGGEGSGVVIVNDRGGCVVDADCLAGQFCNRDPRGGDPTCRTTLGAGRPCMAGAQCTSGVCVDGVCCDRACNRTCESCAQPASLGRCAPRPAGTVTGVCICDGVSGACPAPDASIPDVGPPDMGPPDMGPADMGPADMGPADMGPADMGPPDVGVIDAGTDECTGWRCGRDYRLDGRAGPIGGCGCSTPGMRTGPMRGIAGVACALALAAFRARRRRDGR